MKRLFVLLLLFVIAVAIALGLVINEQKRNMTPLPSLQGQGQSSVPQAGAETQAAPVVPTTPPATTEGNIKLTILSPQNNTTTNDASILIRGTTTPGAIVMINENELKAGADGSFSQSVSLDDGENYFSIVAYTDGGAVAEQQIIVIKNVAGY